LTCNNDKDNSEYEALDMKIAVVGLWHLGEVYSVCLAELGHKVVGIDVDKKTIEDFNKGIPLLPEPELKNILAKNLKEKRIHFTTDFSSIRECDVLWITMDTPVDKMDRANLQAVFRIVEQTLPHIKNNSLIVVSSQIGLGASRKIVELIKKKKASLEFEYAYIPENLRIGTAVDAFFDPKKIVVGTDSKKTYAKIRRLFKDLNAEFLFMTPASAEMVKEAINSYLATSLAFIFDIADICEKVGADIIDVVKSLRLDPRIGEKAYLGVSVGFSGGTLGRALRYLMQEGVNHNLRLPVINAVWTKNLKRKKIVKQKLLPFVKDFKEKKIVFYGLTYKGGVTTLRNSRAVEIIKDINKLGAEVVIVDDKLRNEDLKSKLKGFKYTVTNNPLEAAKSSHCLVFITPSKDLLKLNFAKLRSKMKSPAIFFDTQNFFASQIVDIKRAKFKYLALGR
jgi:UDPglucose 6-dehydrogenase